MLSSTELYTIKTDALVFSLKFCPYLVHSLVEDEQIFVSAYLGYAFATFPANEEIRGDRTETEGCLRVVQDLLACPL